MRVLFLLSDYVLHNSLLTDYVAARPADRIAVVKVPLVLKGKGRRGTAERIVPQLSRRFAAGKLVEFAALLFVTALPKLLARGPSFRRLRRSCRVLGIPFLRSENVMDEATLEFARGFTPDVVVNLCHQILKEPLISLAPLGIVNVHPGVLPEFRGIQPYFWELSEGADSAGVTLHLIEDERIDTGGVLAWATYPVQAGMSVQLNYFLTIRCASALLPACLSNLAAGRARPVAQDPGQGNYFRWPDSAAFDRLRERGFVLVSFRQLWAILVGHHDHFVPERSELCGDGEVAQSSTRNGETARPPSGIRCP